MDLNRYGVQFKSGIRPLWEDESNRDGGRWSIRVKRHNTDRYWENAIMAMIGEQFMVGNEICGMQLSLRYPYDQVSRVLERILMEHIYRICSSECELHFSYICSIGIVNS